MTAKHIGVLVLCVAALGLAGVRVGCSRKAYDDLPTEAEWMCLDCRETFILEVEDYYGFLEQNFGAAYPCPHCDKERCTPCLRCPHCDKPYPESYEQETCPYCKEIVPPRPSKATAP